jgi:hypothetical protein
MKTMVVCFDTGNTTVLLDTVNELLKRDNTQEITFLVIGEAAKSIFTRENNAVHASRVIYLTDWLPGTTLKEFNDRKLSDAEVLLVKEKIAELHLDKAITTSSCFPTALAPYQIAEMLTEYLSLDNNFIYNGDFLQDLLNNPLWVSISGDWAVHVSLLVAMAKEQQLVKQINQQLTCYVVGSSAIDKLYVDEKALPKEVAELLQKARAARKEEIKRQLGATDNYVLFISGSKTVEDVLELLQTLDINMIIDKGTTIRMGLHPGTKDMQNYVEQIIDCLKEKKEFPAQLVINKAIKSKLTDLSILDSAHICEVDLSGDDIFTVANAVASSQPSTIVTQGVISGLPAFCLSRYSNSYLSTFFKQSPAELIQAKTTKTMLTKREMGLPEERAVDIISDKLSTEYSNQRRR